MENENMRTKSLEVYPIRYTPILTPPTPARIVPTVTPGFVSYDVLTCVVIRATPYGMNTPTSQQAKKILDKFGGPAAAAKVLGLQRSTVYRWTWGKPEGTGGYIPVSAIPLVRRTARLHGILLTNDDWGV